MNNHLKNANIETSQDTFHTVFKLHENGEYKKAETLYKELIDQFPDVWQLHFNLGLLYSDLGNHEEALRTYQQGLAIHKDSVDLLYNSAISQKALKNFDEAINSYQKALLLDPDDVDSRFNLAGCYRIMGRDKLSIEHYEKIVQAHPDHLPSLNNLAYVCHKDGQLQTAIELYSKVLALAPDHVGADFMLAALTDTARQAAPEPYIREVFDDFSDHYESKLTEKLHYNLPSQLLKFILSSTSKSRFLSLLDLGCGTGLVGNQFRPHCNLLTGVDLSGRMLELAEEKNIYDALHREELYTFLSQGSSTGYDILIAADVFPYIGDLEHLFALAYRASSADAVFAFSVEVEQIDELPKLQQSGRFAHSDSYIRGISTKAGWQISADEHLQLRMEKDGWIDGCIYGLTKSHLT